MKKTFAALFTAILLCGALCACSQETGTVPAPSAPAQTAPDEPAPAVSALSIAWSAGNYNPYITDDVLTRQNAGLLFSNLVDITPEMDLNYRLAQTIDNSGTTVLIQIRGSCHFTDGTVITAQDAAASLQAACSSASYDDRFRNVVSVEAIGEAVAVTLAEPDSLFAYLLDIPVMKAAEVSAVQPTASGRYTYSSQPSALSRNPWADFAEECPETIRLVDTPTSDALVSGFALGSIDLYLDGYGSNRTSSINASEVYYRRNDLIFLGVNGWSSNPLCATAQGRRLLSALANRNEVANRTYYGQAYAATGALNSLYPCVKGRQTLAATADEATAAALWPQLGYHWDDAAACYVNDKNQPAAVNILSYTGNSTRHTAALQLAEQWRSAGLTVTLTEVETFDNYLLMIRSGEFELYIGEIKLYNNMDLAPFFTGSASYGLNMGEVLPAAWAALKANAGTAGDFETAFADQLPYIPLLWHSGTVVTGRHITGLKASLSGPFYSLSGLQISD